MLIFKPKASREGTSLRGVNRKALLQTGALLTLALSLLFIPWVTAKGLPLLPLARPDLVVTTITRTGPVTVNRQGQAQVPIRVVVKNRGLSSAGIFKVSAEHTIASGIYAGTYFWVAFTVPGQSDAGSPWTSTTLAGGATVTFNGRLIFPNLSSLHNRTVTIRAKADSCVGDEFMPTYCRVNEVNEGNNLSTAISVYLP